MAEEKKRDPRESGGGPPIWSLALAGTGVILLISFIAYAIVVGDLASMEAPWIGAGAVGALLLGGWLYVEQGNLRRLAASQGARYTSTAVLITLVALGITVALNVVANRYDKRFDLTEAQTFTLSDQTRSILKTLSVEVEVLAFFPAGSPEELTFRALMDGYQNETDKLRLEFIDPFRNPLLTEQYQITSEFGTVILNAGEAQQRLESRFDEEALTNGLVQLTAADKHLICFTTDHNELDPQDNYEGTGLGVAVTRLEGQNYETKSISLIRESGVPDDCEVLVAADPQYDFLPAEIELLAAHIASGGHFVLLLEPSHANNLATSMGRYGLSMPDDLVLEMSANAQLFGGDPSYIILDRDAYDFHPIATPITGLTLHRLVRSVSKGDPIDGITVQELARTTPQAWTKTDLETMTDPNPVPGTDRMGVIPLMAVVEVDDPSNIPINAVAPPAPTDGAPPAPPTPAPVVTRAPGARVVVIGDVDFATNALVSNSNNLDLLLNTLAWVVGEEEQISIRPNEAAKTSLTLNLIQGLLMWLICLVVAPGLTVLGAISTWRSRRRR